MNDRQEFERLLKQAENIKLKYKIKDHLKTDSNNLVNTLLENMKKFDLFDDTLLHCFECLFNMGVKYNFLHPVDQKEYQDIIIYYKCLKYAQKEGEKDATSNTDRG